MIEHAVIGAEWAPLAAPMRARTGIRRRFEPRYLIMRRAGPCRAHPTMGGRGDRGPWRGRGARRGRGG
jgi:hypothetical protein